MANPSDVASPEYLEFIADRGRIEDVIIAEIHPKEELTGWTAVSGLTNAYSTSFNKFFAEDKTYGGIYRKLMEMREDDTILTREYYLGPVVDATGGSQGAWYYHEGRKVSNYNTYSQQFTVASASGGWAKYKCSVADAGGGVLAPDLTATIDELTEDTSAGLAHVTFQDKVVTADTDLTFSVYFQTSPTPRDWICLAIQEAGTSDGARAWFHIGLGGTHTYIGASGAMGSGTTLLGATLEDIDLTSQSAGLWTRCSISMQLATGVTNARNSIYLSNADNTLAYDGNGVSSMYLWGAQLEYTDSVGAYLQTTDTAPITIEKNWVVANTTTNGQNPDDAGIIIGAFRTHFATVPKIFDGIYYEPRLTERSLPDVHMESEDLFFGPVKKVSEGELSLNNAEGIFDEVAKTWAWKNAEVKLYFGGGDLVHTHVPGITNQYANIGTFYCEDITAGLEETSLFLRGGHKSTFRYLPPRVFSTDLYPDIDTSDLGKPIPLLYGKKDGIAPIFTGGTQTKVYVIADSSYQTLYSIGSVYNDGVEIAASYLTKDLTECVLEIDESYGDVGAVTCDAIGQVDRGNDWETSADYLKYYGELVGEIYNQYLGVSPAGISSTAATSCDSIEPTEQSLYMNEAKTARSYIRELEIGVMGRTIDRIDGVVLPTVWFSTVGVTTTYVATLVDEDIVAFDPDTRMEGLFSEITVVGDKDPVGSGFRVAETEDNDRVKYLQLDGLTLAKTIETALSKRADAKSLAGRVRYVSEDLSTNVRIVESTGQLLTADIGDKVKISHSRAPSVGGEWDEKVLEIVSITKSFAPYPSVEIILNDMGDVTTAWAIWQAADASPWPNGQGWWCDDQGYADPSGTPDEASKDVSKWS